MSRRTLGKASAGSLLMALFAVHARWVRLGGMRGYTAPE